MGSSLVFYFFITEKKKIKGYSTDDSKNGKELRPFFLNKSGIRWSLQIETFILSRIIIGIWFDPSQFLRTWVITDLIHVEAEWISSR